MGSAETPDALVIRARGLWADGWAATVIAAFLLVVTLIEIFSAGPWSISRGFGVAALAVFSGGTLAAAVDAALGWVKVEHVAGGWHVRRGSPLRRGRSIALAPGSIAFAEIVDTGRPSTIPGGSGGRLVRVYLVRLPMLRGASYVDVGAGLKLSEEQLQTLLAHLERVRRHAS